MATRDTVHAPLIEDLGIRLDVISETSESDNEPLPANDIADVILPGGQDLINTGLLNTGGSGERLAAFSIGNDLLGVDGGWSTETSTQPPNGTAGSAAQISILDDGGDNRLEHLTLHVLDTEAGVVFEGGPSTNQPDQTDGQIANVSAVNDLDGNNLKSIFIDGPVQLFAEWNNDGAGDGTNTDVSAGDTIVGGTGAGGLGGGFLETLSVGAPILGAETVYELQFEGGSQQSAELGLDFVNISLLGDPDSENILDPVTGSLPGLSTGQIGSVGDLPLSGLLGGGGVLGGEDRPIPGDLLSGTLGNHLPADITGGNIPQSITGDLVGELLSGLTGGPAGGLGLPDAGGDILGAILGGQGGGSGPLGGLDLGHVLETLPDAADLNHVPVLDGLLDGVLSA